MNLPENTFVVGNKLMAECKWCGKYVRVDGWLGGLHICLSEKERNKKAELGEKK